MMETLASLRIHPNKATKRVVEMLINTSTQVLHQLGFNPHFQPSLPSYLQTYRRIIAPVWFVHDIYSIFCILKLTKLSNFVNTNNITFYLY